MARIRCRSCGKGYSYQGDCCPHCGAFNRRPKQGYIGADGDYHAVGDKVCYEKKVCYEDQAEKVWKASPDRKPERRTTAAKRPNTTRFTSSQADQVIDRFTRGAGEQAKKFAAQFLDDEDNAAAAETVERFARNFREKTAQFTSKSAGTARRRGEGYAPRRGGSAGKGALIGIGLGILFLLVVAPMLIVGSSLYLTPDLSIFEPRQEPARPDMSVIAADANIECEDYGGYFTLEGGDQLLAFFHDVELADDGILTVKTYCDGTPTRFRPRLVDESNGEVYDPVSIHEWQPSNFLIKFQLSDAFAEEFRYSFHYLDRETDELYSVGAFFRGSGGSEYAGVFHDIPLLDGTVQAAHQWGTAYDFDLQDGGVLHANVLTHYDQVRNMVTVYATHDGDPARFLPYLGYGEDIYEPPTEIEDRGADGFCYRFDSSLLEPDREHTFCYMDLNSGDILYAETLFVPPAPGMEPYSTSLRLADNTKVDFTIIYEYSGDILKVDATHNGDPAWLQAFAYDADNNVYYDVTQIEDDGAGNYVYTFDLTGYDPAYRLTFGYGDARASGQFLLVDCYRR